MLISDNIETIRYYTSNSISTPLIEYQTIPQTVQPSIGTSPGEFTDFERWDFNEGVSFAEVKGYNFEIREHTFVTTVNLSYENILENESGGIPAPGYSYTDNIYFFPYLKVPINPLVNNDPYESNNPYIKEAASFHALYVNATATFVSNSVGLRLNNHDILGHGVTFEHFGTKVPGNANVSDINQRYSSEFLTLNELNKRAYFPTITTTESTPLEDNQYKVLGNNFHPIVWDKDESEFVCKLYYNPIINPSTPGDLVDTIPPYSVIVKGTYLLM
jgi:hypothetical protein